MHTSKTNLIRQIENLRQMACVYDEQGDTRSAAWCRQEAERAWSVLASLLEMELTSAANMNQAVA